MNSKKDSFSSNPDGSNLNNPNYNSAGFSVTVRLKIPNHPGEFAKVADSIGQMDGSLSDVVLIKNEFTHTIRDITVNCHDGEHGARIIQSLRNLNRSSVEDARDDTLWCHRGGKLKITPTCNIETQDDLSRAYTPGVGRVCLEIFDNPESAYEYTIKKNSVAVVTDGSAVLGLGDLGPEAALPVMEGKAILFKKFANINAYPICLASQDVDEIVQTVKNISPGFGGINLEDISSPRCFEIEKRLSEELDMPVFHDDQHGTAVVVLAALINSLKIVAKSFDEIKVVICGIGAGGIATSRLLADYGVKNIIPCDSRGIIYRGRKEGMNKIKSEILEISSINPENVSGSVADALKGADVFIGLSQAGSITPEMVKSMNPDNIVFALANPIPEIFPRDLQGIARIVATGRSDFNNQVNNALCFPGIFRGAIDGRAKNITQEMKVAAAEAIADCVSPHELNEDYIVPTCFNPMVVSSVANRVSRVARNLSSKPEDLLASHSNKEEEEDTEEDPLESIQQAAGIG